MASPTEQLAYFAWENKYNEFKALLVTMNASQVNALNFRGKSFCRFFFLVFTFVLLSVMINNITILNFGSLEPPLLILDP